MGIDSYQVVEKLPWSHLELGSLGRLEIDYFLGVDGLSVPLLILSALVMTAAAISSWEIKKNLKGYFALFLLMDAAIMGVFCALDFFLFYVFYELMLLPLYFLIGMWGGPRREYAALKRSEEHTSELQSLMRISYAVFCLKKKKIEQITNG